MARTKQTARMNAAAIARSLRVQIKKDGISASCDADDKALRETMEKKVAKLCDKLEAMLTTKWTRGKKKPYLLHPNDCMNFAYDQADNLKIKYKIYVDIESLEDFMVKKSQELRGFKLEPFGYPNGYVEED